MAPSAESLQWTLHGFTEFLARYRKAIAIAILAALVGGLGFWFTSVSRERKLDEAWGQYFDIIQEYDDAVKKDSKDPAKEMARAAMVGKLTEWIKQKGDVQPALFASLRLAQAKEEEKKWQEAIDTLTGVPEKFDRGSVGRASAWSALARNHENLGQWDKALEYWKKVKADHGNLPAGLFRLGEARCLTQLGKAEEAEKIYKELEGSEKDPFAEDARALRRLLARRTVKNP